jgi:hypothetical protein
MRLGPATPVDARDVVVTERLPENLTSAEGTERRPIE